MENRLWNNLIRLQNVMTVAAAESVHLAMEAALPVRMIILARIYIPADALRAQEMDSAISVSVQGKYFRMLLSVKMKMNFSRRII